MSYIVFARKYRPQTFDEIIGQSHITTTLKNAISQGRVAHAYIFAGPRGVGKTTTARILAKALDCEKGPSSEPCNKCPSCLEITQGSSLDILEIDGASNRGIDEIRSLRENVKFSPSKGRFKVYIIDEVHMLTAEAFNALLKTLEEPPPHIKFIFATTQAHKVPPTILSRCQRFDFRRISTKDIFDNLNRIVKKETLNVKADALLLIAKYSDGSMRDGQVVLDQIISFTKGDVDTETVVNILGLVDEEILFGLSDAISRKDAPRALKVIDALINDGKDVIHVVSSLIEHFRNISIIKISSSLDSLIDAGPDKIKRYEEESRKFTVEDILYIIYAFSNTIDFMRKTNLARFPLEAAIVKLTRSGPINSLSEIIEKINRLEGKGCGAAIEPVKAETRTVSVNNANSAPPSPEMDTILTSWNAIISYVKAKKISIGSYLTEGYPVSLEGRVLAIGFAEEFKFHKEVLDSPDNRRLIEEALKERLNLDLRVTLISVGPVKLQNRPVSASESAEAGGQDDVAGEPSKKDVEPVIKLALDVFGGTILSEARPRPK